jgi:EAL domain-containing protein (putative c-di-GMP-specific phosphodiesterase class I)
VTGLRLLHPVHASASPFRHVLEPGNIQTVFQPIVDVATGAIVSAEALSRFSGVRRAHLEEVFAFAGLEGWAPELEAACLREALLRRSSIPADVLLSVNVSPDMLSHPAVQAVLAGDLDGLAIEITENAARDQATLQTALADVRRRGAKIVIDDASTGYAGLLRLSMLRPDVVKIDRSLVTGARGDDVRSVVIEALVNLSHRIGAKVVGEGVETLDDLIGLAELDVDYAQGWITGVPADTLPASLPDVVRTCRASRKALMAGPATTTHDALAGVHTITTRLTASNDLSELQAVLGTATDDLGVDAIGLSLLSEDAMLHEVTAAGTTVDSKPYPLSDYPATADALETNTMIEAHVLDPETDAAERALLAHDGFASLLLLPLTSSGLKLGILELRSYAHRQWTSQDMADARTVADHVASTLVRMAPHAPLDIAFAH